MPYKLLAIEGLPLNPFENRVQRIERPVAEANPRQIPVPLQVLYDIMLVLGCADLRYA